MKSRKKLLITVISLLTTILLLPSSIRAYDNKVTFHRRDLNGVSIASGTTTFFKYVTTSYSSKETAYCMNHKKNAPSNGKKLSFKKDITTDKLRFIFDNGYSIAKQGYNKSIMGDNLSKDEAYYATQTAIWLYQGSIKKSNLNKKTKEGKAAIALYDAAQTAESEPAKSIAITTSNTNMVETTDEGKRVYKSDALNVSGTGYTEYMIKLSGAPTGSKIVDDSGKEIATNTLITTPNKFYLIVPMEGAPSSVNVSVSATASTTKIIRYAQSSSSYQDISIKVEDPVTISSSVNLYISKTVEKGSLKILKVDATDEKNLVNLSNVQITVTDSKNNLVASWTTDSTNNPYIINDLLIGDYTVTEVNVPEGYIKANSIIVTTKANETIEVVLKNYKNTTTSIKISKQDITTKIELPGASMKVNDATGNEIDTWISTAEPHYLYNLAPGTYKLIETQAPDGYGISDEIIEFIVKEDGTVDGNIVMYNSKLPETADINVIFLGASAVIALGFLALTTAKLNKEQA